MRFQMNLRPPKIEKFRDNFRDFRAILFGMVSQSFIQLLSIPLFLNFISMKDYVIWIVSLNIAQITNFIDLGTITSNQNILALLKRNGRRGEISKRISLTLNLITFNLGILVIFFCTYQAIFKNFADLLLVIIFGASIYFQNIFGLIEGIKRMNGKNSQGLNFSSFARIVEFCTQAITIVIGVTNLEAIAIIGMISKILLIYIVKKLDAQLNIIKFSGGVNLLFFKSMIGSGIPYVLMKISDTITLSGSVLVLQNYLSPHNLLLYISLRTFVRFGVQISSLISSTFYFELSRNWTNNEQIKFRRNVRLNFLFTILVAILLVFGFGSFGNELFSKWTNNKLSLTSQSLWCGIFYLTILIFSQSQRMRFHAVNANANVSVIALLTSILSLVFLNYNKAVVQVSEVFLILGIFEIMSVVTVLVRSRDILNFSFDLKHDEFEK